MNKQGNLNIMVPAILTLVLASAVLVFGLVILQEMRDVDSLSDSAQAVTNETGAWINTSGYTVLGASSPGFNSLAISEVRYDNGTVIAADQYTLTSNILYNATAATYTDVQVDYSYNYGETDYSSANDTVVGLGTFADFWEIIVLAVVVTIVIGLLLVVFSGRRVK